MRLVDDDKIPIGFKNFFVLVELPADDFGAAQVLNGNEVHEIFFGVEFVVLA